MKKITEYGNNLYKVCSQSGAYRLAFIFVIFMVYITTYTAAKAQALDDKTNTAPQASKAFAVAVGTSLLVATDKNAGEAAHAVDTEKGRITLYPNPVSDYLLVMLPMAAVANTVVTVRSMDGKTVATDTIVAGTTNTVIDVKQVPHGMYVVTIDDVADKQVSRLVKN
jgi:hypothetical protein